MKEIYLDNAAATRLAPRVASEYVRTSEFFANPSSFNDAGRKAAALLSDARTRVARFLNARPDEVVFCASGSEANTLALFGTVHAHTKRGSILVADVEHMSVLEPVRQLARKGYRTVRIPVDGNGCVSPEEIQKLLTPSTILVSVMYANNEVGTIQPIVRIAKLIDTWRRECHSQYPLLHVDACQATTTLNMDVQRLGVDLLTLNGAKAYGPHGSAVLYVRRNITLRAIVLGGSQEGGRRAGTEDVAGACGLAAALETMKPDHIIRMRRLRDELIRGILKRISDARLNGPMGDERLAGNVNVSIPGCDSESLLLELDRAGIRAGSGSACTAHSVLPSHVLVAMKVPKRYLEGVVRFSLSRYTTRDEIDEVIRVLPMVVDRVRSRRARGRSLK